ncbi:type IX secretion system membrane protein PorP/SprF, partial [Bacteroidia bacterium]|nr:type IX secretion system membrane protein PorP/SprF [Bacteroidia bacterium]
GANIDFGKLSIGLSNLQIFKSQEAFEDNANNKSLYTLAKHWMLNASYKIDLNDNLELEPYMLYRKVSGAPGQVDINLFLNWLNKGYAGIAYRDGISFSTMLGINVNEAIGIGYAFDITTHKVRGALGNTHEVGLRFNLDTKTSGGSSEILAQEKKEYQSKIVDLENEVIALKTENNSRYTSEQIRVDTVIIEKVVVKEVIKEVPVVKDVKKGVPTTPVYKPTKPKYEPITESNFRFYVIAGSFATPEAANNYIYRLSNQGSKGYQKYDSKNGRYYVHLGEHASKTDAIDQLQKLKPRGLPLWIKAM